jgi:hypothetical protein
MWTDISRPARGLLIPFDLFFAWNEKAISTVILEPSFRDAAPESKGWKVDAQ